MSGEFSEPPEDIAKREGLVVVYPLENELLLDLDNGKADIAWMKEMIDLLADNGIDADIVEITRSRGGGQHARVHIVWKDVTGKQDPMTPLERVLLQACLGSDRKRELLSALTILTGSTNAPTVFFELPDPDEGEEAA